MSVDVAVIGCGWWSTRAHLPALAADPDARIVALVDPDAANLARAGERFGVTARFGDVQDMLETTRPAAAIVATTHASHAAIARACLDRGLHVLVEKPMTIDPDDAWDLVARAARVDRALLVGYPYHHVPQLRLLRDALAAGVIGRLEVVTGLFASVVRELYRGHPASYQDVLGYPLNSPGGATYSDPVVAGGGQGQTQVTHLAALCLWLTGLQPVSVSAATASFELAVDLADAVSVRFADGAIGSLVSTGSVVPSQPESLELRIFGASGHARVDASAGSAAIHLLDGTVQELAETPPDDRYPEWAPAQDLVRHAQGTGERPTGALGATVVSLIDAMYRSARSGREADLRVPPEQTQHALHGVLA